MNGRLARAVPLSERLGVEVEHPGPMLHYKKLVRHLPFQHLKARAVGDLRRGGAGVSIRYLRSAGGTADRAAGVDGTGRSDAGDRDLSQLGGIPVLDSAAGGRVLRVVGRISGGSVRAAAG